MDVRDSADPKKAELIFFNQTEAAEYSLHVASLITRLLERDPEALARETGYPVFFTVPKRRLPRVVDKLANCERELTLQSRESLVARKALDNVMHMHDVLECYVQNDMSWSSGQD